MKLKGFTLLELLVVMGVVGVLASVMVSVINPTTQKNRANDVKRKSDIAVIQSALEQWRFDNSAYPAENLVNNCPYALSVTLNGSTVTYLNKIPCDPKTASNYFYKLDAATGNYCLRACLETSGDSQADSPPDPLSCGGTMTTCGPSNKYSYTVEAQ